MIRNEKQETVKKQAVGLFLLCGSDIRTARIVLYIITLTLCKNSPHKDETLSNPCLLFVLT